MAALRNMPGCARGLFTPLTAGMLQIFATYTPLTVFQSIPLSGVVVVTGAQELVGMIVEKAVNMARAMNVPVLGVVENMSYFICPDCNRCHSIFGESRVEEAAKRLSVPVVAKLPVDSKTAALCDRGKIEEATCPYLDELSASLE